jgi:hypothetical protein
MLSAQECEKRAAEFEDRAKNEVDLNRRHMFAQIAEGYSVPLLTDDSQIGANLRICADEEDRADFDRCG